MADREQQEEQQERFREALEDKQAQARAKAEESSAHAKEDQLLADDRTQDELSVRAKSTGHGKKTADKWNQ
jgi:hypothetical protein